MTAQRDETITAPKFYETMKNSENNNVNCHQRSRVSSLSSFFSTSAVDGGSRSIFGFRKLARACLLGSGKSGKRNSSKVLGEQNDFNLSCRQDKSFLGNMDGFSIEIADERGCYADYQRRLDKGGTGVPARTYRSNLGSDVFDYQLDLFGVPQKVPDLLKDDITVENNCTIVASSSSSDDEIHDNKFDRRSIVLANVPRNTGLSSILSQVCGGPLEAITLHRSGVDKALVKVELDFLTKEGAASFMKYGRSNLFKVNGIHLAPEWKKCFELQPPALPEDILEEIPEVCRCLIMKRYTSGVTKNKHGSRPKETVLDNLDVSEIQQDFEIFGEIQDIGPIVSRKLCVSISFYCVHDAIHAMDDYENPASQLYRKYFKTWAVWYGKDITDRPCVEI